MGDMSCTISKRLDMFGLDLTLHGLARIKVDSLYQMLAGVSEQRFLIFITPKLHLMINSAWSGLEGWSGQRKIEWRALQEMANESLEQ